MSKWSDPLPWSMVYHDDVPRWLSPYRGLFARYGHSLDDAAQEGRMALVEQEKYLSKLNLEKGLPTVKSSAYTIVVRTVYRRLMGRAKEPMPVLDTGPGGWEVLFNAESREHATHIQLELAEAVERAPKSVKMYLKTLLNEQDLFDVANTDAPTYKLHKDAADYLLRWFVDRYNWRHES